MKPRNISRWTERNSNTPPTSNLIILVPQQENILGRANLAIFLKTSTNEQLVNATKFDIKPWKEESSIHQIWSAVDENSKEQFELHLIEHSIAPVLGNEPGQIDAATLRNHLANINTTHRALRENFQEIAAIGIEDSVKTPLMVRNFFTKSIGCFKTQSIYRRDLTAEMNLQKIQEIYDSAVNLFNMGNINEACTRYHDALEFLSSLNNDAKRAYCYSGLASCYRDLGEPEQARDYAERALLLFKQLDKQQYASQIKHIEKKLENILLNEHINKP